MRSRSCNIDDLSTRRNGRQKRDRSSHTTVLVHSDQHDMLVQAFPSLVGPIATPPCSSLSLIVIDCKSTNQTLCLEPDPPLDLGPHSPPFRTGAALSAQQRLVLDRSPSEIRQDLRRELPVSSL